MPTELIDLTGQRFGKLTVIGMSERRGKSNARYWECLCDCGNVSYVRTTQLTQGVKKSCGCKRREPRKPKHPPRTDCLAYHEKANGTGCDCIALVEMLCVTKGRCSFYKSRNGR